MNIWISTFLGKNLDLSSNKISFANLCFSLNRKFIFVFL